MSVSTVALKASDGRITTNAVGCYNAFYIGHYDAGNDLMASHFDSAKIDGIITCQNDCNLYGNTYWTVNEEVDVFQEHSSYPPTVIKGLTIKSRKCIPNGNVFICFSYKFRKRKKNYHIKN